MTPHIIYDLDDLMVNSLPMHEEAGERALQEYGHSFSELPSGLRASFIGRRVIDIAKDTFEYFNIKAPVEAYYKKRSALFLELVKEKLEAMPGLHASLELFCRNRFPIAVASSGTTEYIGIVLEKFSIGGYFDVIVSGDDVTKGKPDPETFIIAAKKLDVEPARCIVLEDATNGIKAAKAAQYKCIAVKNPYTPPQDLSGADMVADTLSAISLEHIKSLVPYV